MQASSRAAGCWSKGSTRALPTPSACNACTRSSDANEPVAARATRRRSLAPLRPRTRVASGAAPRLRRILVVDRPFPHQQVTPACHFAFNHPFLSAHVFNSHYFCLTLRQLLPATSRVSRANAVILVYRPTVERPPVQFSGSHQRAGMPFSRFRTVVCQLLQFILPVGLCSRTAGCSLPILLFVLHAPLQSIE